MGKKNKSRSETESLRGIIRHLEAENKNLKKQLSRADKEVKRAFDTFTSFVDDELPAEAPVVETVNDLVIKCPKCSKKIKGIELGPKVLYSCSNEDCRFRKTVKK